MTVFGLGLTNHSCFNKDSIC